MPNLAAFTINGTPSADPSTGDPIYVANLSEVLTVRLEQNPSTALSARFQLYDATDPASPLASKDAPALTWNENSQAAITIGPPPNGINDPVTVTMPAGIVPPAVSAIYSYLIRCTVSVPGSDPIQSYERLVCVRSAVTTPAIRKTVPGETTQARARGWSDALNDLTDALEAGGGGGGGGPSAQEPTWAHMYWDDSSMVFNGSDVLTAWPAVNGDMDDLVPGDANSLAAPAINTSRDSVYLGGRYGGRAQGFRMSYGLTVNPLTTSIPVDEDLYVAFYAHLFNLTNGTVIRLASNFTMTRPASGQLSLTWNESGGNHSVTWAPATFADSWLRPGLWEIIHRVGQSWEVFFEGRRYVHSNINTGNRLAAGSNFGFGSGGGSDVDGHYQGCILHYGTLPTREERFGAGMWLAGDR